MRKTVTILGSTGSIGTQALQCCKNLDFQVLAITANSNIERLQEQAREYHPRYVVVTDKSAYTQLKQSLADTDIKLLSGIEGLCEVAQLADNDLVINSVVGMVGLKPTLAALTAGKTVALANKETLVAGGKLVMKTAGERNVPIIPIDSEISAMFQCLQGNRRDQLQKVILTASGGPFFGKTKEQLRHITIEQALNHPNWEMGAKITIDSSTLMNKGLELIEACQIFSLTPDQLEVVVHPQSVIHSAVEYIDGSVIAQLGCPDMMIPIQYALTYPERLVTDVKRLSFTDYQSLSFYKPDYETFSCLSACIKAMNRGTLYPCAVNSANEQAVELFLQHKIAYLEICELVHEVLETIQLSGISESYTAEDVDRVDEQARELVVSRVGK